MNVRTGSTGNVETAAVSELVPNSTSPEEGLLWFHRGAVAGLVLGAGYGSIVPIIGTVIGAVLGVSAGTALGGVMAVLSMVTRRWLPDSNQGTLARERGMAIGCIAVALVILRSTHAVPGNTFLAGVVWFEGPALVGVVYAAFAGLPTPNHPFVGTADRRGRLVLKVLPFASPVVFWLVAWAGR